MVPYYTDLANYRLGDTDMKRTQASLSSKHGAMSPPIIVNNKGSQRTPTIRKISSVDGLTEDEQDKIAAILVSLLFVRPRLNSQRVCVCV